MTCRVMFMAHSGIGGSSAGVGPVRISESVAVNGTTTASAQDNEVVLIYNGEATGVMVAWGSTPDGATTTSTSASTAALVIPAGQMSEAIVPGAGAKFSVKTLT